MYVAIDSNPTIINFGLDFEIMWNPSHGQKENVKLYTKLAIINRRVFRYGENGLRKGTRGAREYKQMSKNICGFLCT